jgi:hypothetical protein
VITSYQFAAAKAEDVLRGQWDLVVFDEVHRLRNVYTRDSSKRAKPLRDATRPFFKLLLRAMRLQNSLLELYGLIPVIDERFVSDEPRSAPLIWSATTRTPLLHRAEWRPPPASVVSIEVGARSRNGARSGCRRPSGRCRKGLRRRKQLSPLRALAGRTPWGEIAGSGRLTGSMDYSASPRAVPRGAPTDVNLVICRCNSVIPQI